VHPGAGLPTQEALVITDRLDPNMRAAATTSEEMATMIVFFASDAASCLTGEVIGVTGGTPRRGVSND
jgi:hypothetical protein